MAAVGIDGAPARGAHILDQQPVGALGDFTSEILVLLRQAIEDANKSRGKEVVALVGVTGSGKSTLVNACLGSRLEFYRDDRGIGRVRVATGQREHAKIGQSLTVSETLLAQLYEDPNRQLPFTFVDCGGFLETRGETREVLVGFSMKHILENATSVRLVICIDANVLSASRCRELIETVNRVCQDLLRTGYQNLPGTIALVATKMPLPSPMHGWRYTTGGDGAISDLRRLIQTCASEYPEGSEQRMVLEFFLRDGGRRIETFDPLDDGADGGLVPAGRLNILFREMRAIPDPRGQFNLTYSPRTRMVISGGFAQIAQKGNELLIEYNNNVAEKVRTQQRQAELGQQRTRFTDQLTALNVRQNQNGEQVATADPAVIRQIQEQLIADNNGIIARANQEKQTIQAETTRIDQRIALINEEIATMDREGSKEVLHWTNHYKQPAIPGHPGSTTETRTDSYFAFIKTGSKTVTTTTPSSPGQNIEYEFKYSGPEVLRHECSPKTGTFGAPKLSTDKKVLTIPYSSGVGREANAEVKVWIARKDEPSAVLKRSGKVSELNQLNTQKQSLTVRNGEQDRQIADARRTLDNANNITQRVAQLQGDLQAVDQSLAQVTAEIQAVDAARAGIVARIDGEGDKFKFLEDYLAISRDEELMDDELIRSFRQNLAHYRAAPAAQ